MTGKAKLTTIALAVVVAAVLMYARPGFAQDTPQSDKEKIKAQISKLNNPENNEVAEEQRKLAAASLLDYATKYPEALEALQTVLDIETKPQPAPNIVIAVLKVLTYKDAGIPKGLIALVIKRLGDTTDISTRAEQVLTTPSARKSDDIYERLAKVLKSKRSSENIRARAAHIIAESGRVDACSYLINALDAGGLSESVVVEIIRALGEIGDKQAVSHLIDLLGSESMAVRKKTAQALRRITYYDFGINKAAWDAWWEKNKNKSRAKWQEDFVLALQKDRAEEMIADLKTVTPEIALRTVMKVFKKPAGNIITPHDRYGERYIDVIRHAVDAIIKNKLKPKEYETVAGHFETLLTSDDEKIRDAVLNYFTSDIPHSASSIKPLLTCYNNPAESDTIKGRALKALQLSVGAADATKMALGLRAELVAAMEQTARTASYTRRELAVDILGAGLKHIDGLMVLVDLLNFEKMPSTVVDDVKLRIRIAHTMIPVLKTNGKLKLTDKNKADIAATLARTFVLDLKVADNIAVPLAYVGYTGEITVGTLKFKGVSELLASRLADTVEWGFGQNVKPAEKAATVRDIRKGVLSAFAKLKNGNTAVTIIAALKNPKVIGPTESMLCETALNTLGLVGGMESVEYLLVSELLKSSNLKIRGQAWESLSVVIKRVYDAGYYEHLIGKEKALNDAEPANLEGSAKSDCVAVKLILQEAKKALSNTITALKARIKELDPKDPAKSAAALVFINGEIAKNKTAVLLELVEALNPTTANTKPVTDAVRKILAVRLNVLKDQDIKTMTYEQIKALTAK